MKTNKIYILLIPLLLMALLGSCRPDLFMLNRNDFEHNIYGLKMSSLDDVDVTGDNSLTIRNNGIVALATNANTQIVSDFTVRLLKGDGIRFAFRTISNNYNDHPNITFDFTKHGCIVREASTILANVDTVKAIIDHPFRIKIKDDGKNYLILADCDTVYYGRTELPATEYVIIESLNYSEAILTGINIANTRDNPE